MISRSFCWAIMKKMTKKWDLETSNAETELKIRIYAKNWARQVLLKIFDHGQSQWSTIWSKSTINGWRVLTWQCDVTLGLTWQFMKRSMHSHMGTSVWCAWEHVRDTDGVWKRVAVRGARAREAETSTGAWRRVWCSFWPFLVGFCSGLAVLSLYAFALAVGWVERWNPKVAGIVGVTAVTRFWQWLLDEGEGNERTSEMSTRTRKSEEWLWYHVNNIKWERKTE